MLNKMTKMNQKQAPCSTQMSTKVDVRHKFILLWGYVVNKYPVGTHITGSSKHFIIKVQNYMRLKCRKLCGMCVIIGNNAAT